MKEGIEVSLEEELSAITLNGFDKMTLNVTFRERRDASHIINGVRTFWNDANTLLIFYGTDIKRWQVASAKDIEVIKRGNPVVHARSPEDADILDPSFIMGWDIFSGGSWVAKEDCGIIRILKGTDAEAANAAVEVIEQEDEKEYTHPMGTGSFILSLIVTLIPNLCCAAAFSTVGFGVMVYSLAAPMSAIGDFAVMWAGFFASMLYIFDIGKMPAPVQAVLGVLQIIFLMVGAVLKSRKYPWTPILFTLLFVPAMLGQIRIALCKNTDRRSFYGAVSAVTAVSAVVVAGWYLTWIVMSNRYWDSSTTAWLIENTQAVYDNVWEEPLNYTEHCSADANLDTVVTADGSTGYGSIAQEEIVMACASAGTVWWMIYTCPVIICLCNAVISAFCFLQVWIEVKGRRAVRVLQTVAIGLATMFMGMYFANVVTGASLQLSSALMGFYVSAICALMVWAYLEIGADGLHTLAGESNLAKNLIKMWNSEICRGGGIVAVGWLIPLFLILTMMNQTVRRCRGTSTSKDKFTDNGRMIADQMSEWNWSGILKWACYWCLFYWVMYVGFTRAVYIFLSWMNGALAGTHIGVSCAICFGVGFVMFLLPPVPGASVYLFLGLVIGAQATAEGGVGMLTGVTIATAVGTITKLAGCAGQYYIGVFLGQSVKVQQMIGVNTVPTRALEKLVSQPGLKFGKVMVLVGGPDWPVSVTCGILRVNLPQMLVGTLPIFICALPLCAAGAFMIKMSDPVDGGLYSLLNMVAWGVSGAVNGGTFFLCGQQWFSVINRDKEELSVPRPEHAAVEELTRKEEAFVQAYKEVSRWNDLPNLHRFTIISATVLHIMAFGVFYMLSDSCFRPFVLGYSTIEGSYEDSGLNGDVFSVILFPMGWGANGLFALACIFQYINGVLLTGSAKKFLAAQEATETVET